ncbi:MAG: phosphoglucosamine mutase [Firmicutes bacterium]|nr:phosphoglucosamine mutase [Bacillota bacterium]
MPKLFGTDGVRGVANKELTAPLAFSIGQAGAHILTALTSSELQTGRKAKIVVGKDTRISSDMLEAALAAGICSAGAQAEVVGVVPTPAVALLTRQLSADAGVVISASHNSAEYNGIKFFNNKGYKLSDDIEDEIEKIVSGEKKIKKLPTGGDLGRIVRNAQAKDNYINFAKDVVKGDFCGLKVALDNANGAASKISCSIFKQLGAEVFVINDEPNGLNINENCGSTHLGQLQELTKATGADIGLAFDGDADRVLAVDEKGNIIDGDKILLICAADMKKSGALKNNTIVATVMSNLGMFIAAEKLGIDILKADVGDRYVIEEMIKGGYNLGGEQSGHIIFHDYNTTGDGIVTALSLVSVLRRSGKTLSSLAQIMQKLPQVLINAKVGSKNKNIYLKDNDIKAEIKKIEELFLGNGRVLIRPSGTEPLVRVMIEGTDLNLIEQNAKRLAKLIENKAG